MVVKEAERKYKCDRCGFPSDEGGICPACKDGILKPQKMKVKVTEEGKWDV